ncbi:MAG: hypothetical protein LUC91_04750 [Prevotella sp.]|nr:hypothetical protein [Prevotella sp.]
MNTMNANDYPLDFYRGVSNPENNVSSSGQALAGIFQFDGRNSSNVDYDELSINWNDDPDSIQTLYHQHKPHSEDRQFKYGYCKIELSEIKCYFRSYIRNREFGYERRPIEGKESDDIQPNPYHGNLLIPKDIEKGIKKNIQHSLATLAREVIKWEDSGIV